jgi:orotate phosphoribosyltransferase
VLIVDDVITAGTSAREAHGIIAAAGAEAAGLVISLDREEVGSDSRSAVQDLEQSLGIPVISIVKLEDLIDLLEDSQEFGEYLQPVVDYRQKYGVDTKSM